MAENQLMLSISGLRGWVGQTLTPLVAARYASAVGSWFKESTGQAHPHLVIGRDSRPSGAMVEQAAVAGLLGVGCRVTTLGLATTPGTAVMIDHLQADGGLVITASHNPIVWNGIKTLSRGTGVAPVNGMEHGRDARTTSYIAAPPPDQAARIIERFQLDRCDFTDVHGLQSVSHDATAAETHIARILKHIDAPAIRRAKLKVVLDSVHGAGGPSTATLLHELGVELVHLYGEPTGQFPHTPEPTAANLTGLCDAVRQHRADLGMAQDPDADRLALVDEAGRYIGEEYTLALCAEHVLNTPRHAGGHPQIHSPRHAGGPSPTTARPAFQPDPPHAGGYISIASNLSTSRMVDDIASRHGGPSFRTPVGEANVAAAMRRHGCPIGGEGNGGVIWPVISFVRDSLAGAALVLELLAARKKKLGEIVAELPRYAIVKDKLPIQPGMAEAAVKKLKQTFASQRVDLQDGIRVDFDAEKSWVHLRPSNTEPILRIIAEAPDEAAARQRIEACRKELGG